MFIQKSAVLGVSWGETAPQVHGTGAGGREI